MAHAASDTLYVYILWLPFKHVLKNAHKSEQKRQRVFSAYVSRICCCHGHHLLPGDFSKSLNIFLCLIRVVKFTWRTFTFLDHLSILCRHNILYLFTVCLLLFLSSYDDKKYIIVLRKRKQIFLAFACILNKL